MEELRVAATKTTPEIILLPEGIIRIRGRSIHENAAVFFVQTDQWISDYIQAPADITRVDITLEYFNSASAKIFVSLLQKITYVSLKNKKFVINWYYEDGDEDILERGQYFASILNVHINLIRIK